jgi:hypothetical protein
MKNLNTNRRFFVSLALLGAFAFSGCTSRPVPYEIADLDPVRIGAVEAGLTDLLGNVQQRTMEVFFDPRGNLVSFEFKHETVKNRQSWPLKSRQQFVSALSRYEADFAERNLVTDRATRTRRIYGQTDGVIEWGQFAYNYSTKVDYSLGYIFKERKVYFTISQPSGVDDDTASSDAPKSSQIITVYLSRAQAGEIAKYFDQQFLLDQIAARLPSLQNAAPDEYEEAGGAVGGAASGPTSSADEYEE